MKLKENIKGEIQVYKTIGIMIKEAILKFQFPYFHYSFIPIRIDQNSNKIYYNYNRKY